MLPFHSPLGFRKNSMRCRRASISLLSSSFCSSCYDWFVFCNLVERFVDGFSISFSQFSLFLKVETLLWNMYDVIKGSSGYSNESSNCSVSRDPMTLKKPINFCLLFRLFIMWKISVYYVTSVLKCCMKLCISYIHVNTYFTHTNL